MNKYYLISLFFLLILQTSCSNKEEKITMNVTSTAYNSLPEQTRAGTGDITAWGDTLRLGMKTIAVSRDLIKAGLTHNTEVKIEGLEGTYLVNDKMNKRWEKKIDIYMGKNVEKAREWGKQEVTISWVAPVSEEENM